MKLEASTVLLTGAAGGIGSAIARELSAKGAKLLLTDLNEQALVNLVAEIEGSSGSARAIAADISSETDRKRLVTEAQSAGVNVLINAAGLNPFALLEDQPAEKIALAVAVNLVAPILLSKVMLPVLKRCDSGHIVNIGSSFGSIGFAGFSTYCATKFAMRGFSEAMRRELADTRIKVHYVAPRATETPLATDDIRAMNKELGVGMDTPEIVARAVASVLQHESREFHLGLPERIYAVINALAPSLVDRALARQLPIIRYYAKRTNSKLAPSDRIENQPKLVETH